jgi:hypothetical protein
LKKALLDSNHPARWVVLGTLDSLRGIDPDVILENDHVPSEREEEYLMGNPRLEMPEADWEEVRRVCCVGGYRGFREYAKQKGYGPDAMSRIWQWYRTDRRSNPNWSKIEEEIFANLEHWESLYLPAQ